MDEDSLLIRRMRKGDEKAIEIFVRKYYGDILNYCNRHVSDSCMAEDMTQETFEHFFSSLETYRHYGKAKNYLYVIAGNLCRNVYRSGTRAAQLTADMDDSFYADRTQGSLGNGSADSSAAIIDMKVDLQRALEELPEDQRTVLILYCFQELKLREIAAVLDIGVPLVKYRLAQARKNMRAYLGEEDSHGKRR